MIYSLICEVIQKLSAKSFVNQNEKAAFSCDNVTLFYWMQFSITQGLQRSHIVFIIQRLILLCLYTGGVSFAFFVPVFEFSLDYAIIWQLHIWLHCLPYLQETQQAKKSVQGLLSLFAFSQQVVNK